MKNNQFRPNIHVKTSVLFGEITAGMKSQRKLVFTTKERDYLIWDRALQCEVIIQNGRPRFGDVADGKEVDLPLQGRIVVMAREGETLEILRWATQDEWNKVKDESKIVYRVKTPFGAQYCGTVTELLPDKDKLTAESTWQVYDDQKGFRPATTKEIPCLDKYAEWSPSKSKGGLDLEKLPVWQKFEESLAKPKPSSEPSEPMVYRVRERYAVGKLGKIIVSGTFERIQEKIRSANGLELPKKEKCFWDCRIGNAGPFVECDEPAGIDGDGEIQKPKVLVVNRDSAVYRFHGVNKDGLPTNVYFKGTLHELRTKQDFRWPKTAEQFARTCWMKGHPGEKFEQCPDGFWPQGLNRPTYEATPQESAPEVKVVHETPAPVVDSPEVPAVDLPEDRLTGEDLRKLSLETSCVLKQ